MLKIEKTVLPSPEQWEIIIEGLRNPMNSWSKMDSHLCQKCVSKSIDLSECPLGGTDINLDEYYSNGCYILGDADHNLMQKLAKAGPVHAKYRRMIPVYATITAPLYWWKEFDTYKVGTVANSCSTMHKIHARNFTLDDFSHEHLIERDGDEIKGYKCCVEDGGDGYALIFPLGFMEMMVDLLNDVRRCYLYTKDKRYWWQMIQLLPTSYNQKRTVMLNYEALVGIYRDRKDHKLDEWHTFCDWIKELPYSELITGSEAV